MKRVFISIVALAAALNLCACGNKSEHKTKQESEKKTENNIDIEIETITEKTTKKGVVNEIALVDPFETLSISIDNEKSAYPECLDIKLDYGEKDYSSQIDYKANIKSADNKKIVLEVKAVPDEAALEDLFGDMKYKIVSDTREYDLPIGDVPICLLDNSLLTKENLESIDKMCHEVVDERIKYSIDNEVFEHDHTGDDEYEIVSVYSSNGRIEDYISSPLDIDLGYPYYFIGRDMDVHNNRLIFVYKSKSDIYYVVTAHPVFLDGELLSDRCTVFTDTAGLLMQYDSEEEAEEAIKDWLDRMVVGYRDGDLIKIANPT
ncbi:hypothetical protein [Ruminococcus flavefaciens]|uniref:hypothetical protein n=1 Tax=Ruminococcus flavefaciens TaxID=1265 RepID=UPI0026ED0C31|nr:hypothetical protein [Ruminococcus flavefaciens]MDD7515126.1 hypothetical protein [Ruminococcus flavefaciens]MDY5692612.1 hypothetical protein [Ruminococcus flavefaciens]